jgi:hypothetical protein
MLRARVLSGFQTPVGFVNQKGRELHKYFVKSFYPVGEHPAIVVGKRQRNFVWIMTTLLKLLGVGFVITAIQE